MKTVGFVIGCVVWVIIGLALFGPEIVIQQNKLESMMFWAPPQPLASLTCPNRDGEGSTGEVVARIANHSGKPQNYEVSFVVIRAGAYPPMDSSFPCGMTVPVKDGETATATCAVETSSRFDMQVQVTAWAEGEKFHETCALGCLNSYQSRCVIAPGIFAALTRPDHLAYNAIIIIAGLILVAVGAVMWHDVGTIGQRVMLFFLAGSTLGLAFVVGAAYAHWLPAAILVIVLVKASLVAGLWLRAHPAQCT